MDLVPIVREIDRDASFECQEGVMDCVGAVMRWYGDASLIVLDMCNAFKVEGLTLRETRR